MRAYDIDGTLARVDYNNLFSSEALATRFENAEVLYKPTEKFIALTARSSKPIFKEATKDWLLKNQPNCEGVFFVNGTEEEIIKKKGQYVKDLNLEGYVDTSIKTLSLFGFYGITGITLYHLILTTGEIKLYKKL